MKTPRRFSSDDLPFKKFRNELDDMFQRFFDDPFFTNNRQQTPACNVVEKQDRYTLEVEIPGVNPNDVEIDLEGNMLKIKGERKKNIEHESESTEVHAVEHNYGSFYRSFTLPDGINEEEISAHNDNGILYIELPKNKDKKSRRIEIKWGNWSFYRT